MSEIIVERITSPDGSVEVAGIASEAIKLQTARTISLTGDVVGSVSFDGTANVSIAATIQNNSLELGTDTTGNYVASITNGNYITGGNGGSEGAALTLGVDATSANTASKVVARDASGGFSAGIVTTKSLTSPIVMNANSIAENITVPSNHNASSNGPLSIDESVVVTIGDNSFWVIQ